MSEAPALAFAILGQEEGAGSSPPALPGCSSPPAKASAGSRGSMLWKASLEEGGCEKAASSLLILEGWISSGGLGAIQRLTANLVPFALSLKCLHFYPMLLFGLLVS